MRWDRVAGALVLQALACTSACQGTRAEDLAACRAAEERIRGDPTRARSTAETCGRVFERTKSMDARLAQARALLIAGDLDAVVAFAEQSPDAPRLWHLAGDVELERGRVAEARRWFERALERQQAVDVRRAANTASRLAGIAASQGKLDEAIRFHYVAVELAESSGDAMTRVVMALGLSGWLLEIGDAATARTVLKSIESVVPPESGFYNDYLLAMGELEAFAGREAAATASFDRCIEKLPAQANPRTELRCHVGRAALRLSQARPTSDVLHDLEQAEGYLSGTEQLFGPDPDRAAELAWMTALAHLSAGDPDAADAALRPVVVDGLSPAMQSRIWLLEAQRLAAAGRHDDAEAKLLAAASAIERVRDHSTRREIRRSLPRELRAPYEALFVSRMRRGDRDGALIAMERALTRDFLDRLATGGDHADLRRGVDDAERRARFVKAYAPRREPSFVHGQLHRRIEAFFAAEGALYRVSIDATAVAIDKVDELPRLLAMIERAAYDADAPEGATLRQLLLPDARLPPQDATLVIVPDAPLVQIRFAALRGPGGYLVERNPVVIAPTLAIATAAPPPTPPGPAVVLGDPDGSLPAARTEATAVAALLDVEARLGPAATRAAVESARRARVLHVASHGKADDDDTNLLLADGPLGSADVLERGIAPDLAVIASCTSAAWTAVGPWASVAGAFLASGSAMVIGALGSVPDGAARVLLTDFHHAAREHDPALALALAQRAAIRAGVPAQTWSTFVALGRPSASR